MYGKCSAVCKNQTPCSRQKQPPSQYCWQHSTKKSLVSNISQTKQKLSEYKELIDSKSECTICCSLFVEEMDCNPPCRTQCGHVFHLACFFQWIEMPNSKHRCPKCFTKVTSTSLLTSCDFEDEKKNDTENAPSEESKHVSNSDSFCVNNSQVQQPNLAELSDSETSSESDTNDELEEGLLQQLSSWEIEQDNDEKSTLQLVRRWGCIGDEIDDLKYPFSVCCRLGRVFVADYKDRVAVFTPYGQYVREFKVHHLVEDICVNNDGNLFTALPTRSKIDVQSIYDDEPPRLFAVFPAVSVDSCVVTGNVAAVSRCRVIVFTNHGTVKTRFDDVHLNKGTHVSFMGVNNLLVTDNDSGRVLVMDITQAKVVKTIHLKLAEVAGFYNEKIVVSSTDGYLTFFDAKTFVCTHCYKRWYVSSIAPTDNHIITADCIDSCIRVIKLVQC